MILTDELAKDFLQYLYDKGYRYLFVVTCTNAVAVSKSKLTFSNKKCLESAGFYDKLFGYEYKLGRAIMNDEEYCINIGKKLNIIDWSAVKVDTKIRVSNFEGDLWRKRYFACYENGKVYAFDSGKTSWSAGTNNFSDFIPWDLAEVVDE
jgi:hypothetical protein